MIIKLFVTYTNYSFLQYNNFNFIVINNKTCEDPELRCYLLENVFQHHTNSNTGTRYVCAATKLPSSTTEGGKLVEKIYQEATILI